MSSLVRTRLRFSASSKMDFNFPHGPPKIEIWKKLDPLHVKSSIKISPQKVEKRQSYGMLCYFSSIHWKIAEFLADRNSACAAWNTALLQGHCFVSRVDCLHLKSNHDKFQLNPIRNCWVIVGLKILQCCRVYVLSADFILFTLITIMQNFSSIR